MYKPKEFADMIGVSVKTLQRWGTQGKLVAKRNPKNRRYYTHKQYIDYIGKSTNEEELVQDLISIIHVFSCRIYGLRNYKTKIEEDEDIAKSLQDRD